MFKMNLLTVLRGHFSAKAGKYSIWTFLGPFGAIWWPRHENALNESFEASSGAILQPRQEHVQNGPMSEIEIEIETVIEVKIETDVESKIDIETERETDTEAEAKTYSDTQRVHCLYLTACC